LNNLTIREGTYCVKGMQPGKGEVDGRLRPYLWGRAVNAAPTTDDSTFSKGNLFSGRQDGRGVADGT